MPQSMTHAEIDALPEFQGEPRKPPVLHPVEELLIAPAANAEVILGWCVRTTGLVPTEPARKAALGLLHSQRLAGASLRDVVNLWKSDPQLDELVYEVEHVAVYVVESAKRRFAATASH